MREDLLPVTLEGKLSHLIQECAEVTIAVTKLQIFGEKATDPKTGVHYDNLKHLLDELSDLQHAINTVRHHLGMNSAMHEYGHRGRSLLDHHRALAPTPPPPPASPEGTKWKPRSRMTTFPKR